jgi:hypothetical protein
MFYALVKFEGQPDPQVMGTTHISYVSLLATMPGVEWVSPPIANGNALAFRSAMGGQTLEGARDYYISAYRPVPVPAPEFIGNQERLARESDMWNVTRADADDTREETVQEPAHEPDKKDDVWGKHRFGFGNNNKK